MTGRQCVRLHECFLKDIKEECVKTGADLFVFYTPEGERARLYPLLGSDSKYFPQKGETLGGRMYQALIKVLEMGYETCVLIGSDVPEIQKEHINRAFRVLEEKDVVFGPTADGGYYLVGMKKPYQEVFEEQSYGHGKVLESTVQSLKKKAITVGCTACLSDMDVREDLQGYRSRMRRNPRLQNSETGRYLLRISRISVIVPVYNEEKTIIELQKQLKPYRKHCEIIFVDGGSTDRTLELIGPGFRVLRSPRGRACQMNLGAVKSRGDILFFLHSDSRLPESFLAEIRRVMKDYKAGCFGITFPGSSLLMKICQFNSNLRTVLSSIMFGDQGIFIERELFFELGMFPEIPIMEDYEFSLRLKKRKIKTCMTKHRLITSDRRFGEKSTERLHAMWTMNRLRFLYRLGVPPKRLAKLYGDIR